MTDQKESQKKPKDSPLKRFSGSFRKRLKNIKPFPVASNILTIIRRLVGTIKDLFDDDFPTIF